MELAKRRHKIEKLGRRSTFGDHQDGVARLAHAQIAVRRFGRMQKYRRRAGALEGRSKLASHVPGFAEPGDDQFSGMSLVRMSNDQLDGRNQTMVEARGGGQNRLRLCFHDLTRSGQPLGALIDFCGGGVHRRTVA